MSRARARFLFFLTLVPGALLFAGIESLLSKSGFWALAVVPFLVFWGFLLWSADHEESRGGAGRSGGSQGSDNKQDTRD